MGGAGVGGPEREPDSRHHRAQAQAPKHNSGTSSHLDAGPRSPQRSTPGLPYISSPIPGTMPFDAQHLSLRSHLTTLIVDTLDRLGGALWPERNQNFKARQKPQKEKAVNARKEQCVSFEIHDFYLSKKEKKKEKVSPIHTHIHVHSHKPH